MNIIFSTIFLSVILIITPINSAENKNYKKKFIAKVNVKEYATNLEKNIDKYLDDVVLQITTFIDKSFGLKFTPIGITLVITPIIIVVVYLFGFIVRWLLIYQLTRRWRIKSTDENYLTNIALIEKSFKYIFIALGLRLSIVAPQIYLKFNLVFLKNVFNAFLVVTFFILLLRFTTAVLYKMSITYKSKKAGAFDKKLWPLIIKIVRITIISFAIIFCISTLGMDITPIIASLGAFTFAVGFALKDSLSSIAAGIVMIMEESIAVGDKIEIPGVASGFVVEISLRTTKINTTDNEMVIVPNNILMNKEFINFRLPNTVIRVKVPFSIAYGADVNKTKQIVTDTVLKMDGLDPNSEILVAFDEMSDFSLKFYVKFFITNYLDRHDKRIEAVDKIYHALVENNIPIPRPTYHVILKKKE